MEDDDWRIVGVDIGFSSGCTERFLVNLVLREPQKASSGLDAPIFIGELMVYGFTGPDQSQAASTALENCRLLPSVPSSSATSAEVAAREARCPPEENPDVAIKDGSNPYSEA